MRVVVNVTSDKCYDNNEWEWGYREDEPMGGHDPYSNSKGCAELVTAAFRRSFFSDPDGPRIASARAGNVIGGGDWAVDRLIPDIMRAALAGETAPRSQPRLRSAPGSTCSTRLSGYLVLAQALWESPEYACGWNFGPADEDAHPVVVDRRAHERAMARGAARRPHDDGPHPHEARYLKLDSSRARAHLGWRPGWGLAEGWTPSWTGTARSARRRRPARFTLEQIERFNTLPPR